MTEASAAGTPEAKASSDRLLLESLSVFLIALLVYLLLSQEVFYKADGQHLVRRLMVRDPQYFHHKLYMPFLIAFGDVLAALQLTPYRVSVLFSAVGVALGIGCVHAGFRILGLDGTRALLATGLVALNPAVLFFATVVEMHGPSFGFAGLAFLGMTVLVRSLGTNDAPRWSAYGSYLAAVGVGGLTALAAGVHASGLILPGCLLPWFLALVDERQRWKRGFLLATTAALVHVALVFIFLQPVQSQHFLDIGFGHPQGPGYIPGIFWQEWLLPFLPISVTFVFAFVRRGLRLAALAFILGMLPYLYGAMRLLVGELELGAYLLPLAIPAAWLTAMSFPRPLRYPTLPVLHVLVLSALCALVQVHLHEQAQDDDYRTLAAGIREATGEKPALLLLGDPKELGPCLVHLPEWHVFLLDEPAKLPPEKVRPLLPELEKNVAKERAAGREVYLTERGESFLSMKSELFPSGPLVLDYIRSHFELEEVYAEGFEGFRLLPKR